MGFEIVEEFERQLAEWWGAPYAVATDCCTHAIELCLRHTGAQSASCPEHTYISIPMTFKKLKIGWHWRQEQWSEKYSVTDSIIDSAVYWERGGYIHNTYHCLSFQYRKPLNLGRGGAILCTDFKNYKALKEMSYDGRYGYAPWAEQNITTMGYHYYMTPETAEQGIAKLPDSHLNHTHKWSWKDYPFLPDFGVFK